MKRFLVILFIIFIHSECFGQVVLIANKLNPTESFSIAEVGNIYRLKKSKWESGSPIIMVNLPASDPLREKFSQAMFKISSNQMEKYYFTQALQGKGEIPLVIKTSKEMRDYIKVNVNALGYIDLNDLDDSVKFILVDGKKEIQ